MSNQSYKYFNTYRPKISKDLIPITSKNLRLIEKKQSQIVDAACELFFEKGFYKTSIREIASASGMSMGQLYHYISSKDDILFLVHKRMQELWYDYLVKFGFEKPGHSIDRLISALRYSIEFTSKNKKLFQFIYSETKHLGKKHLKIILKLDDRNVSGFYVKLLEEVNKDYPIKCDIDLAARFITFVLVFISLRGWNLKRWSEGEITDFLVNFILRGLGIDHE